MELIYRPYLLEFKYPFGVSSNTRTHTPTVFTRIELQGIYGYGEACLPAYLGETTEETLHFLERAKEVLKKFDSVTSLEKIIEQVNSLSEKHNAAKAAIDIALNDLSGKIDHQPFYAMKGFGKSEGKITSCTIALDQDNLIEQKIKDAADFQVLKIKAGTTDDKALIKQVRRFTDKPLYVDVNQGWKDKYFVVEMIAWMKEHGVLLVEQPMPVDMVDDMAWVTQRSVLPTIADESAKRFNDLEKIKEVFSGINIKLMKCGGLNEAIKIIQFCQENNLKIMLGCMAESSCATSAMAHLMRFADFVDLDAPLLIKNDPFDGVKYEKGKVVLNDADGIGVRLKAGFENIFDEGGF